MENLVHYIVVRRDLPLGALLAQTAHAAGESFYLMGAGERRLAPGDDSRPGEVGSQPAHPATPLAGVAQLTRAPGFGPEVAGSSPAPGSTLQTIHERYRLRTRSGTDTIAVAACLYMQATPCKAQHPDDPDHWCWFCAGTHVAEPVATGAVPKPTVVVLGARNEQRLLRLQAQLRLADVRFVAVREPDVPWCGELMAIGLVPGDRAYLAPLVKEFQTVRGFWHEQSGQCAPPATW